MYYNYYYYICSSNNACFYLFYRKVCLNLYNTSICNNLYNSTNEPFLEETQRETSKFDFYANMCFNVPALLAVALFGSWSDTFSRKIPLLFAPIGSILNTLTVLLSWIFIDSSIYYLLIGQFLDGLTGGFACFLMAAFSYSTHVASERNRTSRISIVYACQTLGVMIATFTSGIFLENTSFGVVFLTNIGILLLMVLYIIVFVRDFTPEQQASTETYKNMDDGKTKWRLSHVTCSKKMAALFSFSHMKKAVVVTFKKRPGKTRQYILVLVAVAFLIMVTHGKPDVKIT